MKSNGSVLWAAIGVLVCASFVFLSQFLYSQTSDVQELQELIGSCVGVAEETHCIQDIVNAQPENAHLRAYFSFHLAKKGDEERALEEIESALLISPDTVDYHSFRAKLLKRLGDLEGARVESAQIRELEKARIEVLLSEPVEDIDELLVQAQRSDVAGDYETASRLFERFLELSEKPDPYNLCQYAEVLARLEDFESALGVLDSAIAAIQAEDLKMRATLLKRRAQIKDSAGDLDGAVEDQNSYNEIVTEIKKQRNGATQ